MRLRLRCRGPGLATRTLWVVLPLAVGLTLPVVIAPEEEAWSINVCAFGKSPLCIRETTLTARSFVALTTPLAETKRAAPG